jgi:hypothetical protein
VKLTDHKRGNAPSLYEPPQKGVKF